MKVADANETYVLFHRTTLRHTPDGIRVYIQILLKILTSVLYIRMQLHLFVVY
jgi:uncharacterized membrane protein YGL010W